MMSYYILYLLALLGGLLLIIALLSRGKNRLPNRLLSVILLAALYFQGVLVFSVTGERGHHPIFFRSQFPSPLLIPSLFYLYILSLTVPGFKWFRRYWFHLLPFVFGILSLLFLTIFDGRLKSGMGDLSFQKERSFFTVISVLVAGAYLVPCFRQLQCFHRLLPYYFSNLIKVRLLWLRILLILFMVPWGLGLMGIITGCSTVTDQILVPVFTALTLLLGFFGFRQSVIFSGEELGELLS